MSKKNKVAILQVTDKNGCITFLDIVVEEKEKEKKISKSEVYKKLQFYSFEITKEKPSWDTLFRIYYDSLKLISEILRNVEENPWHPENDYSYDIFWSIQEKLEKLEDLRLKSLNIS